MNGWNSRMNGVRMRTTLVGALVTLAAFAATAMAAPTITTLTPNAGSAAGGTRVTVDGANFSTAAGATRISFGGRSGSAVSCPRTTQCLVTSPNGSGAVNVIATFSGTSNPAVYRYLPAVTKLSPAGADAAGGATVRIDGSGFVPGTRDVGGVQVPWTTFTFGGVPATNVVCQSASSCTATAPRNATGPGTVDVLPRAPVQLTPGVAVNLTAASENVTYTFMTGTASTGGRFTYTVPTGTPTVVSVTPGSGPATVGTPVTILGSNFNVTPGATTIRFGGTRFSEGTPATGVVCTSAIRCTATSPPGVGTVNVFVRVGTLESYISAGAMFTYINPPTVASVAPASGPQAGGNAVTVTGTNFTLAGTAFSFGAAASVPGVCATTTQCTVTVPASPVFGQVDVAAIAGGQTSAPLVNGYTYLEPTNPRITSVTPSRATFNATVTGQPGDAPVVVTIAGAKLTAAGATTVRFGETVATIVGGACDGPTLCHVQVPVHAAVANPTLVDISVQTSGGVSANTAADDFTYTPVSITPPGPGHTILSFTQRDFVSVEGFSAGEGPYTIAVIRGGVPATPPVSGLMPDANGIIEINHPGGSCWATNTPDIVAGDIIRVTSESTGVSEETRTAGVTAKRTITTSGVVAPATVTVKGIAQDALGRQIPIGELEHRFVVLDPKARFSSGRRTLRAFDGGVAPNGSLVYDQPDDGVGAPEPPNWTATYALNNQADLDLARLGSESRIMWLGADPAAGVEATIYEVGADVFGGPQAPCTVPWEPDTQAPTLPGNFTAARDDDPRGDNVKLAWTESTDNREVTGYRIFRGGALIATVGPDTLHYTDLHRPNGTWSYEVAAIDAATPAVNESAHAGPLTATTVDALAPDLDIVTTHAGSSFRVGEIGQYQITVSNAGTYTAIGTFAVDDDLPAGLTLRLPVASSTGTGPALDCGASTPTHLSCVTANAVTWSQGASKLITMDVDVARAAAGEVQNTATLSFPVAPVPGDSVPDNDHSTDTVIVDVGTPDSIGAPPPGLRAIIAFPGRDFVSGEGYDPDDRLTVQVLRNGQVIAESRVQQPGPDGIHEINHPGGGCWSGDPQHVTGNPAAPFPYTPNIRPGDKVRYISGRHGYADEITVAGVNNGRPYNPAPGVIRYHGTAQDANGNPLPIDRVVARLVAGTGIGLFHHGVGAKRSIEAVNPAGEGFLSYDAAGSINWTAEFTGLDDHDVALALASEARSLYLDGDALAGNNITIYERGAAPGDVEKGPSAPCTAVADPGTGPAPSFPTNATPELKIEGVDSGPFQVGSPASYTLTVANDGDATAEAPIMVMDYLPAGVTFTGSSTPGWNPCSVSGRVVTCTRSGSIASGDSAQLVLNVAVGAAAVPSVTNVATVSGPKDFESPNNRVTTTTVVDPAPVPEPDLAILVSHSQRFTVGITDNSYLVHVTNAPGADAATGRITVVDHLPAGMAYNPGGSGGAGWACSAPAGEGVDVTCFTDADVAGGAAASDLRIYATVSAAALAGQPVTKLDVANSADVSVAAPDVETRLSDNSTTDITIVRAAVSPPDTISIVAFPSRDFVSIDGYDMGPDLIDPTDGDGVVRVQVRRNGVLISESDPILPTVDPKTGAPDGIVDVNHFGQGDCWGAAPGPNVTPDIRPGDEIRAIDGRGVAYAIVVQNARADAAQAIDTDGNSVNDTLVVHGIATDAFGNRLSDDAFSNLEQRIVNNTGFALSARRTLQAPGSGILTRDPGSIGWTATYTFPALLDADLGNDAASLADIATALAGETRILASPDLLAGNDITIFESSVGTDGGPAGGAATTCAPIEAPAADLGVTIAAPGGLAGTAHTATITVTNNGPAASANTVVTLDLPAGVTSVTNDAGGTVTVSGRVATVSNLAVAPGTPVTITVNYTPAAAGTYVLAASTQSATADQHPISPGTDMVAARIAVS